MTTGEKSVLECDIAHAREMSGLSPLPGRFLIVCCNDLVAMFVVTTLVVHTNYDQSRYYEHE